MSTCSRREFLGATAVGAAALMASGPCALAALRKKMFIGVQLYSVRNAFSMDVPGTLAGIKKLGYDGVEFAGYATYANDAKGLRKILDDSGLIACGSHVPGGLPAVTGDALAKTVEFNQILGHDKLIVAQMKAATADEWTKQADVFSGIAEKLKADKMRIGYHNHTAEFTPLGGPGGPMPEDIFFGKASPEVFVELDIGHCAHAGADPAAYLKKFTGRVPSVHVKDWIPDTKGDIVGEGIVKWPPIFDACETTAGTNWYIIEEESGKFQGLDGIDKDIQNLKKMLAERPEI